MRTRVSTAAKRFGAYNVKAPSLSQLVSKLSIKITPTHRTMRNPEGPEGRIKIMRKTVGALVRHERLETTFYRGDESRGYAERLISEAVRHGDTHRPTMNLAKFWLEDPAMVPKLFKVLVPRYQNWPTGLPYTRMLRAPSSVEDYKDNDKMKRPHVVIELRGNPYPSLTGPVSKPHPGMIHNVLLEEARKNFYKSEHKFAQQAESEVQALPDEDTCGLENVTPEEIQSLTEDIKSSGPPTGTGDADKDHGKPPLL